MILQRGSTIKLSIEHPVATRHRRDMTAKLLKATLNPNKQQQHSPRWQFNSTHLYTRISVSSAGFDGTNVYLLTIFPFNKQLGIFQVEKLISPYGIVPQFRTFQSI